MPMRSPFTETVTVYNSVTENRAQVWRRTVIRGVQWSQRRRINFDTNGRSVYETETSITIQLHADTGGSRYVPPQDYLTAESRDGLWTLNPANGDDVVVYGACPRNISETYTLDDLNREYGYVSIQAVSDNTARAHLKNWKVVAV